MNPRLHHFGRPTSFFVPLFFFLLLIAESLKRNPHFFVFFCRIFAEARPLSSSSANHTTQHNTTQLEAASEAEDPKMGLERVLSKMRKRRREPNAFVETANAKSDAKFFDDYIRKRCVALRCFALRIFPFDLLCVCRLGCQRPPLSPLTSSPTVRTGPTAGSIPRRTTATRCALSAPRK